MGTVLTAIGNAHARVVLNRRVRVLAASLAEMLPDSGEVLDIGCGNGQIAELIAVNKPGLQFRGLEIMARPQCRIRCDLFDGHRLPLPDGSVDACLFVDVLHHTGDPRELLREAARVTRRYVVLKDHLSESALDFQTLKLMDWVGNRPHGVVLPYNYCSRQQWDKIFAASGLRVARWVESVPLYPFPASLIFGRHLHFVCRLERHSR